MSVEILLATYNGERFLEAQVESIRKQTHLDLRILARDDGSTDRTPELLARFQRENPGEFSLLADGDKRLGAAQNFGRLLAAATGDSVFCADQDDIWLPTKVKTMLRRLRELEATHGKSTPLLVHSDLRVVDAELREIAPSFWRYQNLDPQRGPNFARTLVQNSVTGCALVANRALLALALPIPEGIVMHDWWLALVAAAFGHIEALPEPLALYRQHGRNDIGAKAWGSAWIWHRAREFSGAMKASLAGTQRQAALFLARFGDRLPAPAREASSAWATLGDAGWIARRRRLLRHGLWKCGLLRNLGLLLRA